MYILKEVLTMILGIMAIYVLAGLVFAVIGIPFAILALLFS